MASEVPEELVRLFAEIENGAVEAGAISFAEAVEGALPAVLDRHEQTVLAKVAEEIEAEYQRTAATGVAKGPLLRAAEIARGGHDAQR